MKKVSLYALLALLLCGGEAGAQEAKRLPFALGSELLSYGSSSVPFFSPQGPDRTRHGELLALSFGVPLHVGLLEFVKPVTRVEGEATLINPLQPNHQGTPFSVLVDLVGALRLNLYSSKELVPSGITWGVAVGNLSGPKGPEVGVSVQYKLRF